MDIGGYELTERVKVFLEELVEIVRIRFMVVPYIQMLCLLLIG